MTFDKKRDIIKIEAYPTVDGCSFREVMTEMIELSVILQVVSIIVDVVTLLINAKNHKDK